MTTMATKTKANAPLDLQSHDPPQTKIPLPMVPVPQALETVLTETAKAWLLLQRQRQTEDASSTAPSPNDLIGRISAKNIRAPFPGYPNHNSSIMDGYAVKTCELLEAKKMYETRTEQDDYFLLDFAIVKKVYAGDINSTTASEKDGNPYSGENNDISTNNNKSIASTRTAIYVTTGAVIPAGYDAVIPIEDTAILLPSSSAIIGDDESTTMNETNNNITYKMHIVPSKIKSVLNSTTQPWTWIRKIGCDIPPNSIILSKGEKIQPVHLALVTQLEIMPLEKIQVKRLPRVGVLSTGNELLSNNHHQQQQQQQTQSQQLLGKIPDANRPLLLSQLKTYGNCIPVDLGIVTDDEGLDNIASRLNHVLFGNHHDKDDDTEAAGQEKREGNIDVLITTGGISMGEKDVMEQVFVKGMGGRVHFGRMNMKPGKPTTFITIDGTRVVTNNAGTENNGQGQQQCCRKLVFALPGNPVSASVCSELLVRPCLDLLHDGIDDTDTDDDVDDVESTKQKAHDVLTFMNELLASNSEMRLLQENDDTNTTMKEFLQNAVENAKVHEEIVASITSDIKLDMGRPEYHRVTLQRRQVRTTTTANIAGQYIYEATSTGVQQSSRVLSLRNADGLMMLPRGGPMGCGYNVAKKGENYPVLLFSQLSSSVLAGTTRFKDSMHRAMLMSKKDMDTNRAGRKLMLGVILCVPEALPNDNNQLLHDINAKLVKAFGGEKEATILQSIMCIMPSLNNGTDEFSNKLCSIFNGHEMNGTNVIFVIVPANNPPRVDHSHYPSSTIAFRAGLEVNHAIAPFLTKNANALSQQLRVGAASQDGIAALFENTVGTVRDGSALIITCSDLGLEGAIGAVKGSLGHVISLFNMKDGHHYDKH